MASGRARGRSIMRFWVRSVRAAAAFAVVSAAQVSIAVASPSGGTSLFGPPGATNSAGSETCSGNVGASTSDNSLGAGASQTCGSPPSENDNGGQRAKDEKPPWVIISRDCGPPRLQGSVVINLTNYCTLVFNDCAL